jgi:hypothetical protein
MLFLFILGAFGGLWWPGIEVDAPPPGRGDPWWWRLGMVVVGGISAIVVSQIQPIDILTVTGVFVALGSGKVGATIVGAVIGAAKK